MCVEVLETFSGFSDLNISFTEFFKKPCVKWVFRDPKVAFLQKKTLFGTFIFKRVPHIAITSEFSDVPFPA